MFQTDTRKPDCPIAILYSSAIRGEDDMSSLFYSQLYPVLGRYHREPVAVIRATEHGDYSGGSAQRSNYEVLVERFGDHLISITGSHGYRALGYDATLGPVTGIEDLDEILSELGAGYSLVDDEHHSNLESELEAEAWGNDGARDFRKALEKLIGAELPDSDEPVSDVVWRAVSPMLGHASLLTGDWGDLLFALWRDGCEAMGINGGSGYAVQTGCVVHFYIDEWIERAPRHAVVSRVIDAIRSHLG